MKKYTLAVAIVAAALAAAPSGAQTSSCYPVGVGVVPKRPVGKGVPSSAPIVRYPVGRGVTP